MRRSLNFALCFPASRRLANIKLRRSLRPGFFFMVIPPKFFATSPHPLALHSRLYPPRSLYHYPTHKRKPSILRGIQRRPHWALVFSFELLTQLAVQNRANILPYTTALPKGSRYLTTSAYLSMNTPRSSLCMVLYVLTTELFSPAPVCRSHPFLHS